MKKEKKRELCEKVGKICYLGKEEKKKWIYKGAGKSWNGKIKKRVKGVKRGGKLCGKSWEKMLMMNRLKKKRGKKKYGVAEKKIG